MVALGKVGGDDAALLGKRVPVPVPVAGGEKRVPEKRGMMVWGSEKMGRGGGRRIFVAAVGMRIGPAGGKKGGRIGGKMGGSGRRIWAWMVAERREMMIGMGFIVCW